ncbi:glucose-6-phosphate isomerase [Bordetella genomosp. 1]|uniref:Glucose-6-phosphate isomerase n=1 Tax=Bordetella genomosp. 1 TaxID=1395607 RepID=A0A261S7J9_9BORD|nr:hypothetical protein [Bordetella genomosp. 1]OZI32957.1 glucose-6-phosphate isomerase [Bordetella genomosp. 1]
MAHYDDNNRVPACWSHFLRAAEGASLDARTLRMLEPAGIGVDLALQPGSPALTMAGLGLLAACGIEHADARSQCAPALPASVLTMRQDGDAQQGELLARMRRWVEQADASADCRHVVLLGEGALDCGLRGVLHALSDQMHRRRLHCAGPCGGGFGAGAEARHALIVIGSLSFDDARTRLELEQARDWLRRAGVADPAGRIVAVTADPGAARAAGIASAQIFALPQDLPARHAWWAMAPLVLGLAGGWSLWLQLSAGAAALDQHVAQAPLLRNAPVQMALASLARAGARGGATWHIAVCGQALAHVPNYVQQLNMGDPAGPAAGPVVWSLPPALTAAGWLERHPEGAPVDFVALLDDPRAGGAHGAVLAECLAERRLLSLRQPVRPSTLIMLPRPDARSIGALLALYEHHNALFEAVLARVHGCDGSGPVRRRLAAEIERQLGVPARAGTVDWHHDASTGYWIDRYRHVMHATGAGGRTA